MSSESSFDNDFDDLSSLLVGLVPDLASRVLTGVPGVRDDGRNDSSASFERLTISLTQDTKLCLSDYISITTFRVGASESLDVFPSERGGVRERE